MGHRKQNMKKGRGIEGRWRQTEQKLNALFKAGCYAEMAEAAQAIIATERDSALGWKALGTALYLQRKAGALAALKQAATLLPLDIDVQCTLGGCLRDAGRSREAVNVLQSALLKHPGHAQTAYNLGMALMDMGKLDESSSCFRRSLEILPNYVEAHNGLGVALIKAEKNELAIQSFRNALSLQKNYLPALTNLAVAYQELKDYAQAIEYLSQVLAIDSNNSAARTNFAYCLQMEGKKEAAFAEYRLLLNKGKITAELLNNMGILLRENGSYGDAQEVLRRAIEMRPDYAEAHNSLGNVYKDLGMGDAAAEEYRQSIKLKPTYVAPYQNLASLLLKYDKAEDALSCCEDALRLAPTNPELHRLRGSCQFSIGNYDLAHACYLQAAKHGSSGAAVVAALHLPAIMGTFDEVLASRQAFAKNIDGLIEAKIKLRDPLREVGKTNFYLAYHGLNDRDLQVKVAGFFASACPSLLETAPHCKKTTAFDRPRRIGFISSYFRNHSVMAASGAVIRQLANEGCYDVYVISENPIDNEQIDAFSMQAVRVPKDLAHARAIIGALKLDVLFYLDIGMEAFSYFLSFSRLAPLQCVFGGHPVTTGIGNVDIFLSDEISEIEQAQEHYSETLVKMRRGIFSFQRPQMPGAMRSKSELGFTSDCRIYLCPMKLQKFHPDFDFALGRILELDAAAKIVLFEDKDCALWTRQISGRLAKTIPARLMDRIVFHPWVKNRDLLIQIIAAADVVLDPFHFGMGTTAAIMFSTATPYVTCPSKFMRGRAGYMFSKMCGIEEVISLDMEEYVQSAIRIAHDNDFCRSITKKMKTNSDLLFDQAAPASLLSEFLMASSNYLPAAH